MRVLSSCWAIDFEKIRTDLTHCHCSGDHPGLIWPAYNATTMFFMIADHARRSWAFSMQTDDYFLFQHRMPWTLGPPRSARSSLMLSDQVFGRPPGVSNMSTVKSLDLSESFIWSSSGSVPKPAQATLKEDRWERTETALLTKGRTDVIRYRFHLLCVWILKGDETDFPVLTDLVSRVVILFQRHVSLSYVQWNNSISAAEAF